MNTDAYIVDGRTGTRTRYEVVWTEMDDDIKTCVDCHDPLPDEPDNELQWLCPECQSQSDWDSMSNEAQDRAVTRGGFESHWTKLLRDYDAMRG